MNSSSESSEQIVYSATDISLILGGVAAAFATIVYSLKHVKQSSCCGFKCNQVVVDEDIPQEHPVQPQSPLDLNNLDIEELKDLLMQNIIAHSEV